MPARSSELATPIPENPAPMIRTSGSAPIAWDSMCGCEPPVCVVIASPFPGSEETFPFGPETSVFKVAGKMFALSQLRSEALSVSLKCEPRLAEQLREAHAAVTPGYHLNKRHWNTVAVDGSLSDQMIRDMIEDSYDLVVSALPRKTRLELGWEG